MIRSNFHTHTCYCDGKNTPEELVLEALNLGFESLGFSGHSYLDIDEDCSMGEERLKGYISDIQKLRKKYENQIELLLGLEQDSFSEKPKFPFDYLIGSVHYVSKNGELLPVDLSAEEEQRSLDLYYDGNFDLYARDFFESASKVLDTTGADIVGHFDLVSKYMERRGRRESEAYLSYAREAVEALSKKGKPFEINTGAMVRGYRTAPYPSVSILKMIHENKGRILFSSDCHDKRFLNAYFDKAALLAKEAGFESYVVLHKNGMEERPLD